MRGNGKRKLAVFEDPNCGYCKRSKDVKYGVDNVTVYLFPLPHAGGPDRPTRSRHIWCSKRPGQGLAATGWCATRAAQPRPAAAT